MPIVTLNQHTDTPARREVSPGLALTYLYDRSRDSKKTNAPGQDFVTFRHEAGRLAFAVCDGVSQSFYGDLAARFLGERLAHWLWAHPSRDWGDQAGFEAALTEALIAWTADGSALVRDKQVNPTLPQIVKDALERKRDNGSEAMFVAGVIDVGARHLAACWMGDMCLWLWGEHGEAVPFEEAAWETKERWSTRLGPKSGAGQGRPHTLIRALDDVLRVTVHTDGIGSRAGDLRTISLAGLNRLAADLNAAPASDDLAILDIDLQAHPPGEPLPAPTISQPDPAEAALVWDAIPGAEGYRVQVEQGGAQWTVDVPSAAYFLPPEVDLSAAFRVQALALEGTPGLWSAPYTIRPLLLAPPDAPSLYAPPLAARSALPEPVVAAVRPFRHRPIMIVTMLEAAMIAIGWIVRYLQGWGL
jgi:hypothetical protein